MKNPGSYKGEMSRPHAVNVSTAHPHVTILPSLGGNITGPGDGHPVARVVCHGLGSLQGLQLTLGHHTSLHQVIVGWKPLFNFAGYLPQNLNDCQNCVPDGYVNR